MSEQTAMFTLGVEEEYQIIDPATRELSSCAESLLPEAEQKLGAAVQHEIHLSQIEVATPVCHSLGEARTHIIRLRRAVIEAAAHQGKSIASSASHPLSRWEKQRITPMPRYQELERDFQQLAREQSIFGCHVHVGVQDRAVALQALNHARPWLPCLLALSANSPFWWGVDTGYASYRTEVWSRWPFSGPPPLCTSLEDYQNIIHGLISTGGVEDPTKIYWDMRPSERYSTLEVRIMDASMTIDDVMMMAGLVRALVRTCYQLALEDAPVPGVRHELIRSAQWRAARYGLETELVDLHALKAIPARDMINLFLTFLRPALEENGDWDEVSSHIARIFVDGNGAARQRTIYQRTGNLQDVVDYLIQQTALGTGAL